MTYEYICTDCSHNWEQDQKISEKPIIECPKCGNKSAKRLVSGGTGFQLKGAGWANDGYK